MDLLRHRDEMRAGVRDQRTGAPVPLRRQLMDRIRRRRGH